MKPAIIIPTLNPYEKLNKSDITIVIINDGSKRECIDIFKTLKLRFKCDVLTHTKNMERALL